MMFSKYLGSDMITVKNFVANVMYIWSELACLEQLRPETYNGVVQVHTRVPGVILWYKKTLVRDVVYSRPQAKQNF